ncbi:helix-turn-helix domain-containing protein [Fundidesulfovibrio putealis]|uniref:helix-turn-helix domain-containing protein n=1 Tax=Fundidesulfovibrio putealis TaxID=270496 RepID=UPI000423A875|nr:helix-turn-helix transcriptional regulator [Fundidesulfovibrio putealis]
MSLLEELKRPVKAHPLNALLKLAGIKKARVAEKLGVSLSHLNNVLLGNVKPSEALSDRLEDIWIELGTSPLP